MIDPVLEAFLLELTSEPATAFTMDLKEELRAVAEKCHRRRIRLLTVQHVAERACELAYSSILHPGVTNALMPPEVVCLSTIDPLINSLHAKVDDLVVEHVEESLDVDRVPQRRSRISHDRIRSAGTRLIGELKFLKEYSIEDYARGHEVVPGCRERYGRFGRALADISTTMAVGLSVKVIYARELFEMGGKT